jgi:hypothetical protein
VDCPEKIRQMSVSVIAPEPLEKLACNQEELRECFHRDVILGGLEFIGNDWGVLSGATLVMRR